MFLKETTKPSGKFLRVWAKNQWRLKFFEKNLKFTYKNLNGKLVFLPIFSPIFQGLLSFYTTLQHTNILGGRETMLRWAGGVPSSLGGNGGRFRAL